MDFGIGYFPTHDGAKPAVIAKLLEEQTRYAYKPDTDDNRRAIVRADSPTRGQPAAPPSGPRADQPGTRTH
jgi:hypothetical protein